MSICSVIAWDLGAGVGVEFSAGAGLMIKSLGSSIT